MTSFKAAGIIEKDGQAFMQCGGELIPIAFEALKNDKEIKKEPVPILQKEAQAEAVQV